MPEHEARLTAFIDRCRELREGSPNAFYAHVDSFCKVAEALLTAGEASTSLGVCESECNPHEARCGAKFCTYEDMAAHEKTHSVEASPSRPMADIALCTCQVISGGAVSLNLSCPLHGISLGHKLSAPMVSGLLLTLKSECEAQHARAELAEHQIATLTAERDHLAAWLPHWKAKTEAAEARVTALEAELVALQTLLEQRASRFFDDHGEVDTEYVAAELRALLSPPPTSQETT